MKHLVCREQIHLFQEALKICVQHEQKKKEDFTHLTDWIETSHIKITEEQLNKVAREKLPAGVNATATKKYIDWVAQNPQKAEIFQTFGRKFWLQHKKDIGFWQNLWRDPLSMPSEEKEKRAYFPAIPADLRAAILRAKLNGALMIFPESGLYVGHWSFNVTKSTQDWNLGLFTFINRPCHDFLVVWKGFLSSSLK